MTEVGQLATSFCDGRAAPDFCSGLAVVSRFPFKEIEFMGYTDHGDAFWNDGEYFARKVCADLAARRKEGLYKNI